jgi:hypothetical protein
MTPDDRTRLVRLVEALRAFQYGLVFGLVCLVAIAVIVGDDNIYLLAAVLAGIVLTASAIWYVRRLLTKLRDVVDS